MFISESGRVRSNRSSIDGRGVWREAFGLAPLENICFFVFEKAVALAFDKATLALPEAILASHEAFAWLGIF